MKKLWMTFLLGIYFFLPACSTVSPNNERSKALALAAENSAGLLAIAGLPIQYYCAHNAWPAHFKPNISNKELLSSIHGLHYYSDRVDFAADFQLRSFIPGDPFAVNWHMVIMAPDTKIEGLQVSKIALEADEYQIFISFNYEFNCYSDVAVG